MIILHIDNSNDGCVEALTALLKERGYDVTSTDGKIRFLSATLIGVDSPAVDANPEVAPLSPAEIPAKPGEMEITLATADIPAAPSSVVQQDTVMGLEVPDCPEVPTEPAPQSEPEPAPSAPQPPTGELSIQSLSSVCLVPYTIDASRAASELHVNHLEVLGDYVSFVYCGMSFKYPVEKQDTLGATYLNVNPQFSDTTIRVVASVSDSNDGNVLPVLLKLVSGEKSGVVFGTDMQAFLLGSPGDVSDGKVPA